MVEAASNDGANIFTTTGPLTFLYLVQVGEDIKCPTLSFFPPPSPCLIHVCVLMHECTSCALDSFLSPHRSLALAQANKGTEGDEVRFWEYMIKKEALFAGI